MAAVGVVTAEAGALLGAATRKIAPTNVRTAAMRCGSIGGPPERAIDQPAPQSQTTQKVLIRELCVLYCQIWVGSSQFFEIITRGAACTRFRRRPATSRGFQLIRRSLSRRASGPRRISACPLCEEHSGASIARRLEPPASGTAFYYLVRAEDACPVGQGLLGTNSSGTPITGRSCPRETA